jgi:rhodanese-related sulfurtransferase
MHRRHAVTLCALGILGLAVWVGDAAAQGDSIYRATLAEADQRTGEVSTEQLRGILADGSAVVIDTRSHAEFAAGHIPGARYLPGARGAEARIPEQAAAIESLANGDKGRALVLYCNGPFCQSSKRLGERLVELGFTDVRRYQLGMPVWRTLGGPTEVELEGIVRIFGVDRTAVFFDARPAQEFAEGSLPGAHNLTAERLLSGRTRSVPLPQDDFNTRIVLFGRDAAQARVLAEAFGRMPWHNVMYFPGAFEEVAAAVRAK